MYDYQKVIDISNRLIEAVDERDGIRMQELMDQLEDAYKTEFGDRIDGYRSFYAFVLMNLGFARYFSFNNMFELANARYAEVASRMEGVRRSRRFSKTQKAEIESLFIKLEQVHKSTPEKHRNLVVNRMDTRCCLCRVMPANKTGSHMVPNFLSHPTFSWDGKGKRFHEAMNHDFLNEWDRNCSYYGREVPEWRFAKGEGKDTVTEEDLERNINQIEYDNEFCSGCEDRFGVVESAYSQFYNGQKKTVSPRVAYLFWLSVLWRMSMGSMSIFMDMNDELALRRLLDENLLGTAQEIADSSADLGNWKYAMFRAVGLKDGDKGILGYRKECSPYVVMYNDLVMVFYHSDPTDEELAIGPIRVEREKLNDWHSPECSTEIDRRAFWDVRDWFVESSYDFFDPSRERALITIREHERSKGEVIANEIKEYAVNLARLVDGPPPVQLRLRKFPRILAAWGKLKDAAERGEQYDPLKDEELFLQQRDFDTYYSDLANLSRDPDHRDMVPEYPFYQEARAAIKDAGRWGV